MNVLRGDTQSMSSDIAETERARETAGTRLSGLIEPGSLLEATPECLVVAHADGRILFANRRVETLTGFSHDELLGRPVDELVGADVLVHEPGSTVRMSSSESVPCVWSSMSRLLSSLRARL